MDKDNSVHLLSNHQFNSAKCIPRQDEGIILTESTLRKVTGLVRTGQDGARATAKYYSKAGKEERKLVTASFYTGITGGILWYVLIYYWEFQSFTSQEIGLMGSIGFAVGSIGYLVGGYLADKLGRRRVTLLGLASTAIGLLLFLFEKNLAIYSVAYAFTSLGGSLAWPSMTTLLAAKTSPSNMKFLYGVQGFVNQIGLTIATFLGIFGPSFLDAQEVVELSSGYLLVFGVTAICAFVPLLYVARVTETERKPERLSIHFDKRMRKILLVYSFQNALIGAGAALVIPWLPIVFKQGLGATDNWVAFIITLSNIVIAVGWFIIPHFANLRGSVALITVCQIASVVFLVLIPHSPILLAVALLYTLRSFLMLVPSPVLSAYVMNIVDERIRASFLSLSQLAWELAFSGSYFVAGYLWANDYSKVEPFYYAGALYVVASLIFYFYFRNVKEATDTVSSSKANEKKTGAGAS